MNSPESNRRLFATTSTGEKIYLGRVTRPETLFVESWKDTGEALSEVMRK